MKDDNYIGKPIRKVTTALRQQGWITTECKPTNDFIFINKELDRTLVLEVEFAKDKTGLRVIKVRHIKGIGVGSARKRKYAYQRTH